MVIKDITDKDVKNYNSIVTHPLQSFEWGEFRKKTEVKVIRKGIYDKDKLISGFQITIHKIPHTSWTIGYLPKSLLPTPEMIDELKRIGKQENCIFIQLEPNTTIENGKLKMENGKKESNFQLKPSFHPLFTKYTFILDLTKSEEELLKNMHHKTRYNIKVAQKHEVSIIEDNSDEAFEIYLKLTSETTKRQKFYAHTQKYHRLMWETLKVQNSKPGTRRYLAKCKMQSYDKLTAHLLLASYKPSTTNHEPIILVAWILFVFHDTLYYPYGASSSEYREVMASNLIMWEAIKLGKKLGLKKFDMWGALNPNPNKNDPWYGFHRFKEGYGPQLTEFVGSYDLVINPVLYQLYKLADKLRWMILRLKD